MPPLQVKTCSESTIKTLKQFYSRITNKLTKLFEDNKPIQI